MMLIELRFIGNIDLVDVFLSSICLEIGLPTELQY